MRPNLSVEKIAGALAVLGTAALISACGGGDTKPPVNANEVAPSGDKKAGDGHCGADAKHAKDQAACGGAKGAGSCGAKGDGSCGAKTGDSKPADTSAASTTTGDAKPTDATKPADPKAGDTKAADTKAGAATPAATGSGKKPPPPPPAKKGGSSGCGAGTCAAKK
jgi:hypothetical protein